MALPSTTTSSGLAAAILSLDWIDHVVLGKARKRTRVPSVLLEDGFIRAVLREASLLKKEVAIVAGDKQFRKRMLKASGINWRGATVKERNKAVTELAKLIRGMPSQFAPGVDVVLDEQGRLVVDDAHRELGKKFTTLKVDPVFSLRNEEAITAIRGTTSIFFPSEYEVQAVRFRRRAQNTIATGLEDGLGRREIARELRKEFSEAALHESYWETVAAVHVNRARSFSSASTYAGAGVTKYEVLSVLDERTTKVCRMMDGRILSVASALGSFDAFEGARTLAEVRQRTNPFMRVRGDGIFLPDGTRTATIGPKGGFSNTLTPTLLNAAGVNMPPYHFRCRTTVIPVIDSVTAIPPGGALTKADRNPPSPPRPTSDPGSRGERRDNLIGSIRTTGFVPGSVDLDLLGTTTEARSKNSAEFFERASEEFRTEGRRIVASDPKAAKAFNAYLKAREKGIGSSSEQKARREAAKELVRVGQSLGAKAIPARKRAARKKAFQDDAVAKVRQFLKDSNLPTDSLNARLDVADVKRWSGDLFDAWGGTAEGALGRVKWILRGNKRGSNLGWSDAGKWIGYDTQAIFHHEFGHGIEHHNVAPRKGGVNRRGSKSTSYWNARVEARGGAAPARSLRDLTGNPGYWEAEVAKEDKWGDPYMGKIYDSQSSEVVAMLAEAYGGNVSRFRAQLREDPETLMEFLGWQASTTRGEEVRRDG